MELQIYVAVASLVMAIDIVLAVRCIQHGKPGTEFFSVTAMLGALACGSYLASVLSQDYLHMKVALAIFFSCIPVLLCTLLAYLMNYLRIENTRAHRFVFFFLVGLSAVDVANELLNPITENVMKFDYNPAYVEPWLFQPQLPYQLHLLLCYAIIAVIIFYLAYRIVRTPSVYRTKYFVVMYGLIFAVLFNAVVLALQTEGMLDYSQLSYSLLGIILYWNEFHNKQRKLLTSVRELVLDELGHPVVLFGEENVAAMVNAPMAFLIPNWKPGSNYRMEQLVQRCGFKEELLSTNKNSHFQWIYENPQGNSINYRVDNRVLMDEKQRVIGRLLVFTDMSLEVDLLTGFRSKASFERDWHAGQQDVQHPTCVAICDVNKLSAINALYGERTGDACIRRLAKSLRRYCPENCYFARYSDANLLVVGPGISTRQMREYIALAKEDFERQDLGVEGLGMQSAIAETTPEYPSVLEAAQAAAFSMRSRKLMDGTSAHSSLLDSLAQVLSEGDELTEAHVQRTNALGSALGQRLNLNDLQVSILSLLCLLHDVGKIGIPLEVLNKPGRLDAGEWKIMQSHVQRGYRIVAASKELSSIADCVLHHHESWNGKGYPSGLEAEDIPLLSRVIAIVDTYDAMTNDRPYHKGCSSAEARAEIERCAGTQFDPFIAQEFLQMMDELQPVDEEEMRRARQAMADPAQRRPMGAIDAPVPWRPDGEDGRESVFLMETSTYILDGNNLIIQIDEAFTRITGYTQEDVEGRQLSQWDLLPEAEREEYRRKVLSLLATQDQLSLEHHIQCKDGSIISVLCIGRPKFNAVEKQAYNRITIADAGKLHALGSIG